MRVLVVENWVGTPMGLVGPALLARGADIDLRRVWQGDAVPATPDGYAGLVVLGGAQSALDDADHPSLPQIAALTRAFTDADTPVLGICLGAQLVARGHGATNILGRPIEFGWRDVRPTPAGQADPLLKALGEGAPVFHWHLDTFTLPPGAVHLAASDMTALQAFRIGRATYGIQFHFEADRALVKRWGEAFHEEIAAHAPDWPARHKADAARHGARADAVGAAIAAAWADMLG